MPDERDEDITNKSLWLNKDITVEGMKIFWIDWYKHGIQFNKDILTENSQFITAELRNEKYGINTTFFFQAIPSL